MAEFELEIWLIGGICVVTLLFHFLVWLFPNTFVENIEDEAKWEAYRDVLRDKKKVARQQLYMKYRKEFEEDETKKPS